MADMLNAKELAAMVRVLFAQVPADTKEREAWILKRCTKEIFDSLGDIANDLENACEAELVDELSMNFQDESAGHCISPAAVDAGAEKSNLNRADQLNLRALAEHHLHEGFSYVEFQAHGSCNSRDLFRRGRHFTIFESIKAILDEPGRVYLDEQVKQCRADVEQLEKKLGVREKLWGPLNHFLQVETADLPDGDGRAAADDLRALLAKHGTDAIVETLSMTFADKAKEGEIEQGVEDDMLF